jgi:hypothetical protein
MTGIGTEDFHKIAISWHVIARTGACLPRCFLGVQLDRRAYPQGKQSPRQKWGLFQRKTPEIIEAFGNWL